ncbi:hypothetical protein [Arthrobacter sp. S41]|nr:hypothetical protein [Arthrobacter sp. S41]
MTHEEAEEVPQALPLQAEGHESPTLTSVSRLIVALLRLIIEVL